MVEYLFIGFAGLVLLTISLALIFIPKATKKGLDVKLSQGKLINDDTALKDVIPFLKVTNAWKE